MTPEEKPQQRAKQRSLSYTEMMNSGQQRLGDQPVDEVRAVDAPPPPLSPEEPKTA